ncbi:MAG: dual specificity protein phosphatase family protein [Deltaproteobacteria bacterium]|nr:dual specificity protein phosphatase family protein [Deltaproteobacteria bacterium]
MTPKPKTSQTDPIRVDFVSPDVVPPPGRIGLTFAPGKQDPAARAGAWDRDLSADLQRLRSHFGTDMLVSLIEDGRFRTDEFELLGIGDLFEQVEAQGMETVWFPIQDVSVPTSLQDFVHLIEQLVAAVRAGGTVVVHCRGGLGRSGLVAASCLVALGTAPEAAVAAVRRARRGAVETFSQAAYVRTLAEAWERHR